MTSSAGQWRIETRAGGAELSCGRHETLEGPLGAAHKDPSSPAGMRCWDCPHSGGRPEGRSQPPSLVLWVGSSCRGCSVLVGGSGGVEVCAWGVGSPRAPQAGRALAGWQCIARGSLPHSCRELGDEGREVLVQRSPWSSLGPSLARELSAGCRSGVPAEVWDLHPHPLQQPWVRIAMPLWGGRARAAGTAGPTGLLPKCCPELCQQQEPRCCPAVCPSCCPPTRRWQPVAAGSFLGLLPPRARPWWLSARGPSRS